jgi:hypothetical protein
MPFFDKGDIPCTLPLQTCRLDDGLLEYFVQKVEETGIGPNVIIMIVGLVVVGVLNVRHYTMITRLVYLIHILKNQKKKQKYNMSYLILRIPRFNARKVF